MLDDRSKDAASPNALRAAIYSFKCRRRARGFDWGSIKEEDSMVVLASPSELSLRDGAVRRHAIHSLRQHLR
jgi:hypothetical protein